MDGRVTGAPQGRRILVITGHALKQRPEPMTGLQRRFAMFLSAFATFGRIEILHILAPADAAGMAEGPALDAQQSALWGFPVSVRLACRGPIRRETFLNHYLAGLLDAADQPDRYHAVNGNAAAVIAAALDSGPDIIFIHRLGSLLALRRSRRSPRAAFFDLDDVEHWAHLRRCLSGPKRPGTLGYLAHAPAILAAERAGVRMSRLTFVCSETDRRYLARVAGRRVAAVPNALDPPDHPPALPAAPTILFLGNCEYPPNAEAADRLALRIAPLLARRVPEARILIAGIDSERLASRRHAPASVAYLGYVDDLPGLYAQSRIVCAPISNGSGTRVKLIEAAGFARPMVSTRIGAEGLVFADGQEILLRDDDAGFAEACAGLLRDEARCHAMGLAARDSMRRHYAAPAVRDRIVSLIAASLADSGSPRVNADA